VFEFILLKVIPQHTQTHPHIHSVENYKIIVHKYSSWLLSSWSCDTM